MDLSSSHCAWIFMAWALLPSGPFSKRHSFISWTRGLASFQGPTRSTIRTLQTLARSSAFPIKEYARALCYQQTHSLHLKMLLDTHNRQHYLTFRMLQYTSSEVNGYNCYKHLKIQMIKRGTGDKIKNNDKIDTNDS